MDDEGGYRKKTAWQKFSNLRFLVREMSSDETVKAGVTLTRGTVTSPRTVGNVCNRPPFE